MVEMEMNSTHAPKSSFKKRRVRKTNVNNPKTTTEIRCIKESIPDLNQYEFLLIVMLTNTNRAHAFKAKVKDNQTKNASGWPR